MARSGTTGTNTAQRDTRDAIGPPSNAAPGKLHQGPRLWFQPSLPQPRPDQPRVRVVQSSPEPARSSAPTRRPPRVLRPGLAPAAMFSSCRDGFYTQGEEKSRRWLGRTAAAAAEAEAERGRRRLGSERSGGAVVREWPPPTPGASRTLTTPNYGMFRVCQREARRQPCDKDALGHDDGGGAVTLPPLTQWRRPPARPNNNEHCRSVAAEGTCVALTNPHTHLPPAQVCGCVLRMCPWRIRRTHAGVTQLLALYDDDDWGLRARGLQWSFCAHNYKIVTSQCKTIRLGLD